VENRPISVAIPNNSRPADFRLVLLRALDYFDQQFG
jgi:hypothetical protein